MPDLTDGEKAFLRGQRLGRLATVLADGSPTVAPVGFELRDDGTVVVTGFELERSAKWRNLQRDARYAFTVDDGIGPTARGVLLRGTAQLGDGPLIQLRPERVVSWGIDTKPYTRASRGPA